MLVDTSNPTYICLTQSVDDWEIKYYSRYLYTCKPHTKYLKNAGVVNLNEYFGASISHDLKLELRTGQYIYPTDNPDFKYTIPDADRGLNNEV